MYILDTNISAAWLAAWHQVHVFWKVLPCPQFQMLVFQLFIPAVCFIVFILDLKCFLTLDSAVLLNTN